VPWARIGEFVGQRDLTVTANTNTYTHVLADETEVDYAKLLVPAACSSGAEGERTEGLT
jgi:hypothetical protein